MTDVSLFLTQISGICALIISIGGVWKLSKEIKKPKEDLKERVDKHDECLDRDKKRIDELEDSNKLILQSLMTILNHEITGNGVDGMKRMQAQIQEYLINR